MTEKPGIYNVGDSLAGESPRFEEHFVHTSAGIHITGARGEIDIVLDTLADSGLSLLIPEEDNGLISLTKMWKMANSPSNKKPADWLKTQQAPELFIEIGLEKQYPEFEQSRNRQPLNRNKQVVRDWCKQVSKMAVKTGLIQAKSGNNGGTYTPITRIAIAYGSYASPPFHNWALKKVEQELASEIFPQNLLLTLQVGCFVEKATDILNASNKPDSLFKRSKSWYSSFEGLGNSLRGETLPALVDSLKDLPVFPAVQIDEAGKLLGLEYKYHWLLRSQAYEYIFSDLVPVSLASINSWFAPGMKKSPNLHPIYFDEAEVSKARWLMTVETYWQPESWWIRQIFPSGTIAWVCSEYTETRQALNLAGLLENNSSIEGKKEYLSKSRNALKVRSQGFDTQTPIEDYSLRLRDALIAEADKISKYNDDFAQKCHEPFLKANSKLLSTIQNSKDVQRRCRLPDGTIFTTGSGHRVNKISREELPLLSQNMEEATKK